MLYHRKTSDEYDKLAEQVVEYAKSSGFDNIKADFSDFERPASLKVVDKDVTLTPDFSATRNGSKYYFELAIKNNDNIEDQDLISKWKALEAISKMKGGGLELFVPHGSFKYANDLVKKYNIDAKLNKLYR